MQSKNHKVIHIISGLDTGGAERALTNLIGDSLIRIENVMVVSLRNKGRFGPEIEALGVKVEALNIKGSIPNISAIKKLLAIYAEFKPDIIQGWMYHGNLAALYVYFRAKKQASLVWNIRHSLHSIKNERIPTRIIIHLNKCFSKHPSRILFNSRMSNKQHNAYGFSNQASLVIPNGFDLGKFKPNENKRKEFRKTLEIDNDAFCIGHAARNHPMKNHQGFITAATAIADARTDCLFIMCGTGINYNNSEITNLIPDKHMHRFRLIGEQSDMAGLMTALDALCMCSLWGEAFPNVIGEAMATGVTCIATDIGDTKTIIGDHGFIIPSDNHTALVNTISLVLNLDHAEIQSIGKGSRDRIKKLYSIESISNEYQETYSQILTES